METYDDLGPIDGKMSGGTFLVQSFPLTYADNQQSFIQPIMHHDLMPTLPFSSLGTRLECSQRSTWDCSMIGRAPTTV
jgi:hypothetical protein